MYVFRLVAWLYKTGGQKFQSSWFSGQNSGHDSGQNSDQGLIMEHGKLNHQGED